MKIPINLTIFAEVTSKSGKSDIHMAKQVKIKDIAELAGVSAGTVDRILHNRGNVSAKSREAVEKVLAEVGYKYNIHTSAISFRKVVRIAITIPTAAIGEYWGTIKDGIEHALEEYSDISIDCIYSFYNQFDVFSCREAFSRIEESNPDAVIIGQTFAEETQALCSRLDSQKIPYVFVDSVAECTNPVETFTTDQHSCGYLQGRLLHMITPPGSSLAIFNTLSIGDSESSNSQARRQGFIDYLTDNGITGLLKEAAFSVMDPEEAESILLDFLERNRDVKGIAVLNSRGHILADILEANRISDIRIVSFDLTSNNRRCLRDGYISALLCQKPELQGFNAVRSIINKLLYNNPVEKPHHLMPIDIIFKENLPFYREIP